MMWAGVIGSPIEHSLSPVIHRAAWEDLGVEGWEYRRIEQDESSLPEFISGLDESFRGLSVTMPCKQAIIPLLDAIDPLATGVGAVNTVVPSSGVLAGFNTDVTGIASAIRRACSQADRTLPTTWHRDLHCCCAPFRGTRFRRCCILATGRQHRTGSLVGS